MMLLSHPRVRWHQPGTINFVADGNSIIAGGQDGDESDGSVPGYLHRHVSPFTAQSYVNVAIGGQNTTDMINHPEDVDAAFDEDKINVLIVQEGTNQLAQTGDTPQQAVDALATYFSERLAANPWAAFIIATAPPYYTGDVQGQEHADELNNSIDVFNAYLRTRYRGFSSQLIDNRQPRTPYAQSRYPDYLKATFFSSTVVDGISNDASYITEPDPEFGKVHWTAAGIALLAPFWADALLRVPLGV